MAQQSVSPQSGRMLDNWHRNSANEEKMHNRTKKRKPEIVIFTSWNHMTGNYKKMRA